MKRIFALILTLALALSVTAVPAYAAESKIDNNNPSATHDVKATYNADSSGTTVYSVTITWGEMEFYYDVGAWNPATHENDANWRAVGNTVTVTNHSNADVTAKLSYTAKEKYAGVIGGSFDKDTLELVSAVGKDVNDADTKSAALTLDGVLDSAANDTTVGTITVTLLS